MFGHNDAGFFEYNMDSDLGVLLRCKQSPRGFQERSCQIHFIAGVLIRAVSKFDLVDGHALVIGVADMSSLLDLIWRSQPVNQTQSDTKGQEGNDDPDSDTNDSFPSFGEFFDWHLLILGSSNFGILLIICTGVVGVGFLRFTGLRNLYRFGLVDIVKCLLHLNLIINGGLQLGLNTKNIKLSPF